MPVEMEQQLRKEAKAKGLTGKHRDAYVYGTMRKTGWKPEREKAGTKPAARKAAK